MARYNGPSVTKTDEAVAIAVDTDGNVYVTGQSRRSAYSNDCDFATLKYDANGNELWVARYSTSSHDYARDIAIDAAGNVYITGMAYGSGNGADFTTIKYDTDGNQLWVAYYGGVGNDGANGIAVDGDGNVYVTGAAALGTNDCATVKYDSSGNELWVRTFDGTAHIDDGGTDIAVDENGNVYVTGTCMDTLTYYNFLTICYNPMGMLQWHFNYNGPDSALDESYAIAVKNGRVCVVGKSYDNESNYDYATVCLTTDGAILWAQRYNGPGNGGDEALAVAMDDSGYVYVTGKSNGAGTYFDYATIKYSPNGTPVWLARYDGPVSRTDEAYDIAVDDAGNVYVTGKSKGTNSSYDYATIKYNSSGNLVWEVRYDGPVSGWDGANAIVLDDDKNVYITGESDGGTSGGDYATIKYSQPTGINEPPPFAISPPLPEVVSVTRMFSNRINVKFSKTLLRPLRVSLFDILGRRVYSNFYNSIPISVVLEGEKISRLSSGIYVLQFSSGSQLLAGIKVMKVR